MKNAHSFRKFNLLISLWVASLVLLACGGDGPNIQTAQFIDDPVSGLTYSCTNGSQTTSGTTNELGQFNYWLGQSCTFTVGKVTLGTLSSIPSDGKVTPQDVAGVTRSATSAPSAVAIAQFLHSLNDGTLPGKIVIPAATRDALNVVADVSLTSSAGVISPLALQSLVISAGKTLVSPTIATAALDAQITQGNVSPSMGAISANAPAVLNSIVVTSAASSNPAGLMEQLTATGYYSDGSAPRDITNMVTWVSSDASMLTVSSSGLARGLRVGNVNVSASLTPAGTSTAVIGTFMQTTTAPLLQSIEVTNTASPPAGLTDQLMATGTYSDGSTSDLTTRVAWASSDASKVTLSTTGLATGLAQGSATVTASYTPVGSTTAVVGEFSESVLAPTVVNVVISYIETGLTTLQKNATAALQAIATLTNSVTQIVSSLVDWAVALVNGGSGDVRIVNGLIGTDNATLTGMEAGDVSISATYLGKTSNSLSLTVTPAIITGVAASGAPIENGDVEITCADGSIKSGTTDSKGAFSIDVSAGCPAPYVLVVSNTVGDAKQTLVSVQPTAVQGSTTVNITPLTHAIAATLATNGDPLTLASAISSEKNNITSAAVSDRNAALVASLSQAMTTAGVSGTPNLFSTTFTADRTGMDKLLDNLKVVVGPSGVSIINPAASKVDDMANVGSNDVASNLNSASITMNKDTNFSAGLAALPAAMEDASVVDAIQAALNACFTLPAASRFDASTGLLLGKCTDLTSTFLAADYKNDGKDLAQEFSRWMMGASATAYDNAKFLKPEIVRFYSNSVTDSRALVRFGLQRSDGVGEWFMTVAEKSANTGDTWKLRGNQRDYRVFVNGYVNREEQLRGRGSGSTARPKGAYYHSGINLYFGINNATTVQSVKFVRVKGPGLPTAGVYLRYLSGCDSNYVIAASATSTPTACTSTYRLQYRKATSGDPENFATQSGFDSALNTTDAYYAQPAKSDSEIQAIAPFSAYRFEVFRYTNNTVVPDMVYVERLRSRPIALGTNETLGSSEVDKLVFNVGMSETVKNLIDPLSGFAFTGGNSFPLTWVNIAGAPPANSVQIQSKLSGTLYQDETNVRLSAVSANLTNSPVGWGNMSQANTSGNFNLVQLRGRDMNDLQYFHNWRY